MRRLGRLALLALAIRGGWRFALPSLERQLRAPVEDGPGSYVICSKAPVIVAQGKELSSKSEVAPLATGQVVEVTHVEELPAPNPRVRGQLSSQSWISLRHPSSGFRWATPKEPLDAINSSLEELSGTVALEDVEGTAELMYLKALFGQRLAGLPHLASFETEDPKATWVMFGKGLESWKQAAGDRAFDAALTPVSAQLRREILRSIDKKKYSQPLFDAYTQEQLYAPGQFKGFLDRFREVKDRILTEIGGASGLPSSTGTASAEDWKEEDLRKWLKTFRDVTMSTRCFQADLYFGHALFGLCLRRLARRFDLALSFEEQEETDVQMLMERFKNFAEMLAKDDPRALGEVLSLTPTVLAAIRKQTEAIFGQGLRDELQQPIERAVSEIKENSGEETPPIAKQTAMLLDAAASGELRMLSVGVDGKERIIIDAITFGVFLQEAEDDLLSTYLGKA